VLARLHGIRPALPAVVAIQPVDDGPELLSREIADYLAGALGRERRPADEQQRFDNSNRGRRRWRFAHGVTRDAERRCR